MTEITGRLFSVRAVQIKIHVSSVLQDINFLIFRVDFNSVYAVVKRSA
jgi:hypothetical protein